MDEINKNVYLNHTYLKKFGAFGFEFDSEHEFQYLLRNKNHLIDNEYCLNQNGDFVPGITKKDKSSLLICTGWFLYRAGIIEKPASVFCFYWWMKITWLLRKWLNIATI